MGTNLSNPGEPCPSTFSFNDYQEGDTCCRYEKNCFTDCNDTAPGTPITVINNENTCPTGTVNSVSELTCDAGGNVPAYDGSLGVSGFAGSTQNKKLWF